MKRIFIVMLLLCVSSALFAEEEAKQEDGIKANSISLDLFPLVKGFVATNSGSTSFFCFAVGYERLIAPHFTIGANVDLFFGSVSSIDYFYFGISGVGRYYPMSENAEKFFLGASLGFNRQSYSDIYGFMGITASLSTGYRIMMGKAYVEPSMSYALSKISSINLSSASVVPLGWQGGLRFGFPF